MSRKTHDLAVKVREYQDREGATKAQWQNIGALMESDDGKPFLMLEAWVNLAALPRREGASSVLVSCFEPREQNATQSSGNGARAAADRGAGGSLSRNGPGQRSTGATARNGAAGRKPIEDELNDEIPF